MEKILASTHQTRILAVTVMTAQPEMCVPAEAAWAGLLTARTNSRAALRRHVQVNLIQMLMGYSILAHHAVLTLCSQNHDAMGLGLYN